MSKLDTIHKIIKVYIWADIEVWLKMEQFVKFYDFWRNILLIFKDNNKITLN